MVPTPTRRGHWGVRRVMLERHKNKIRENLKFNKGHCWYIKLNFLNYIFCQFHTGSGNSQKPHQVEFFCKYKINNHKTKPKFPDWVYVLVTIPIREYLYSTRRLQWPPWDQPKMATITGGNLILCKNSVPGKMATITGWPLYPWTL